MVRAPPSSGKCDALERATPHTDFDLDRLETADVQQRLLGVVGVVDVVPVGGGGGDQRALDLGRGGAGMDGLVQRCRAGRSLLLHPPTATDVQ